MYDGIKRARAGSVRLSCLGFPPPFLPREGFSGLVHFLYLPSVSHVLPFGRSSTRSHKPRSLDLYCHFELAVRMFWFIFSFLFLFRILFY